MENNIKWRFAGNGGTKRSGLDTSDLHTFMKDREASLAREICQNSNDALRSKASGPVKVEFHSFDMKTTAIPHVEQLIEELERCYDYWKNDTNDIAPRVYEMIQRLKAERIDCLRISDFNTTGLNGVLDYENETSPWYSLLHGSGASNKGEQEGGSKGVGKYATFVNSAVRTVFYTTYAEQNKQKGFEGMAYFCSSKVKDSPKGELTIGLGYYGVDEMNNAIPGEPEEPLDSYFKPRQGNNYGTDIYIIGFDGSTNWKEMILAKVLDSFMVAIARGRLEVQIDDIVLNKNTYKTLSVQFADRRTNLSRSVVSQSVLLKNDDGVIKETIDVEYDGEIVSSVELIFRKFTGEEQYLATSSCSMIRYPYMKIQDYKNVVSSQMGVSAICILPQGKLSTLLKKAENPEHTEWQWERITDLDERALAEQLYTQLKEKVKDVIIDHLKSPNTTESDAEGAKEYLPEKSDEVKEKPTDNMGRVLKAPKVSKPKKKRTTEINTYEDDTEGNGVGIDLGEKVEVPLEELLHKNNQEEGRELDSGFGDDTDNGKKNPDGSEKFVRNRMSGTKYRFFCRNKVAGLYSLVFRAPKTVENVELELSLVDGAGQKEALVIEEASLDGTTIKVKKHKIVSFSIREGELVNLQLKVPTDELFSVEVSLYAVC